MEVKATFDIEGSFKLTGRGLVIYGDILEGTVSKGNFILLNKDEREVKLQIKDINFLDWISEKVAKVGLTFHYDSDEHRKNLEALKVDSQTATIVDE